MDELHAKYERLRQRLRESQAMAVAFSGGVDSAFLLKAAHDVLGENCIAVTMRSPLMSPHEVDEAAEFCTQEGVKQIVVEYDAMAVAAVSSNETDRCYWCKRELLSGVMRAAGQRAVGRGVTRFVVAEGSNTDDAVDYRPGARAVDELGVASPLRDAGLSKADVRALSAELGLPTWNKPSFACLASRVPYGEAVTPEKLARIDAAEQVLRELGFSQYRVRAHEVGGGEATNRKISKAEAAAFAAAREAGEEGAVPPLLARIEVLPAELGGLLADKGMAARVHNEIRNVGFRFVTLDLAGYRAGSLNEGLGLGEDPAQ